jgi:hypothetical protein
VRPGVIAAATGVIALGALGCAASEPPGTAAPEHRPPATVAAKPAPTPPPHLELGARVGHEASQLIGAARDRSVVLDERGTGAAIVAVDTATGQATDLYTTTDRFEAGGCDDTARYCVVVVQPCLDDRDHLAVDEPKLLLFIDGNSVSTVTPPNFTGTPMLTHRPVSPDGRIVAIDLQLGATFVLHAWDRTTGDAVAFLGEGYADVVAWTPTNDGGWHALVVAPLGREDVIYDWNLSTGAATRSSQPAPSPSPPRTSPDGTRRLVVDLDAVTVETSGTTRRLAIAGADAAHLDSTCCAWIDDRYVQLGAGLIDTDTMTVVYTPELPRGGRDAVTWIPGTRAAIVTRKDGFYPAHLR